MPSGAAQVGAVNYYVRVMQLRLRAAAFGEDAPTLFRQKHYRLRRGVQISRFSAGMCYGLVLIYLTYIYGRIKGTVVAEAYRDRTLDEILHTPAGYALVRGFQSVEDARTGVENLKLQTKRLIEHQTGTKMQCQEELCHEALTMRPARRVAHLAGVEGFYLVGYDHHGAAIVSRPPVQWRYFDPNWGEFIFRRREQFVGFMEWFFKWDAVKQPYGGLEGMFAGIRVVGFR
jgi:hypothetical protein